MEFFKAGDALFEGGGSDLRGSGPVKAMVAEYSLGNGLGEALLIGGIGEEPLSFFGIEEAHFDEEGGLAGSARRLLACSANFFCYRVGRPPFLFGPESSGWPTVYLLIRNFTQQERNQVEEAELSPHRTTTA